MPLRRLAAVASISVRENVRNNSKKRKKSKNVRKFFMAV